MGTFAAGPAEALYASRGWAMCFRKMLAVGHIGNVHAKSAKNDTEKWLQTWHT